MSTLRWHYGPMSTGKSSLALQTAYNFEVCGRDGALYTAHDRAGEATISSRLGISAPAREVTPTTDIYRDVLALIHGGRNISYVIADEAQFYTPTQVDQLGEIVDSLGIDVYAFGIGTDFTGTVFPGSQRLFEIADQHLPLQLPVMCWCGAPARMNARLVNGEMVTEGEQVVMGDIAGDVVRYVLLCRYHFTRRVPARPDNPAVVCLDRAP